MGKTWYVIHACFLATALFVYGPCLLDTSTQSSYLSMNNRFIVSKVGLPCSSACHVSVVCVCCICVCVWSSSVSQSKLYKTTILLVCIEHTFSAPWVCSFSSPPHRQRGGGQSCDKKRVDSGWVHGFPYYKESGHVLPLKGTITMHNCSGHQLVANVLCINDANLWMILLSWTIKEVQLCVCDLN